MANDKMEDLALEESDTTLVKKDTENDDVVKGESSDGQINLIPDNSVGHVEKTQEKVGIFRKYDPMSFILRFKSRFDRRQDLHLFQ